MYNYETAKQELDKRGPALYLKALFTELNSATTMVRTGAENDSWVRVGEGVKRLVDCQTALKAYMDATLPN